MCHMFANSVTVNSSVVAGFDGLVNYHVVNTSLGAVCTLVNLFLMMIFLSTPAFRTRYVLLIQLCIADTINSIAIVLTGLNRITLYSTAYSTLTLPVRTTLECVYEPWLVLKLVGDLLIPISTLWMGIERFTAIMFPLFYRFSIDGKATKYVVIPGISVIFVIFSIMIGYLIAYGDNHLTNFYCGRKAAFGDNFGAFIYICNIVCNVASTILNGAAYCKAGEMAKTQPRMKRQVEVIRYYLIISVLSTILVSLPNTIALFQIYVITVSDAVSKPAYWMQTVNSGIHFFVYLCLNRDFRGRTKGIFHRSSKFDNSSYKFELEERLNGLGSGRRSVQPAHL